MNGGFSFCGVNISQLGLYYAPELQDTYVYGNAATSPEEDVFTARKGGILYGTSIKPKDFKLRCVFEDKHINDTIVDTVLNFFTSGKSGKLIFDNRDWLWYNATVINVDTSPTNYANGTITINFKAYYPFARTNIYTVDDSNSPSAYVIQDDDDSYDDDPSPVPGVYESQISFFAASADDPFDYVGYDDCVFLTKEGEEIITTDKFLKNRNFFLTTSQMPDDAFTNVTASKSFILYNAGNVPASVAIRFNGEADTEGFVVYNRQTGQEAKFVAFTRTATTDRNMFVISDSLNGKTVLTDGTTSTLMFLYHDYGEIELVPSLHYMQGTKFEYHAGSSTVIVDRAFDEDMIGKYVYLDGNWHRISKIIDGNSIQVEVTNNAITKNGSIKGDVVLMNELAISIPGNTEIDSISFLYKHTFR